jgi:hypothetical protein
MTARFVRGAVAALAVAVVVNLAGCSSKVNVSGKVTYNGKAVTSGSVSLIASDHIQYSGQIGTDGSYAISGVPSGTVKILVSSPNPEGAGRGKGSAPKIGEGDLAAGGAGGAATGWFPLPDKYADLAKTDLTGDVRGNPAVLNVELK